MKVLRYIQYSKSVLEYLGGSHEPLHSAAEEETPLPTIIFRFQQIASTWWFRGLWWGILTGIILLFCGQTSKFIYIDF